MHLNSTAAKLAAMPAAVALLCGHLAAQQPMFRAAIDMVLLNVAVTDKSGKQVLDLRPEDFSVFENGRRQALELFQHSNVPLSVMLLIDVSGSMSLTLPLAQEAATGFVDALRPGDLASIVPFERRMHNPLPFTGDRDVLDAAIRATKANGETALFDTVYIALKELRLATAPEQTGNQPRRQAVLLLTDGYDSSSLMSFDDALDSASRSDAGIYVIRLPEPPNAPERLESPEFVLGRFAAATGGRVYPANLPEDLPKVYKQIKAELDTQYLLAYRSDDGRRDGGYRRIAIHVGRPGLTAHTRPGYFAEARTAASVK